MKVNQTKKLLPLLFSKKNKIFSVLFLLLFFSLIFLFSPLTTYAAPVTGPVTGWQTAMTPEQIQTAANTGFGLPNKPLSAYNNAELTQAIELSNQNMQSALDGRNIQTTLNNAQYYWGGETYRAYLRDSGSMGLGIAAAKELENRRASMTPEEITRANAAVDRFRTTVPNYENKYQGITNPSNTTPIASNRDQIYEIDKQIAEAEKAGDTAEVERLKAEREKLVNNYQEQIKTENTIVAGEACTFDTHFQIGVCINAAFAWIGTIITYVFGALLWLAGYIFDMSVSVSITDFNKWLIMPGVVAAWILIRDAANICFIFVLLYIALGTILEFDKVTNKASKMIVDVIIIALLVNFSGFFTRVVIDASNVIAYEFYIKMDGYDPGKGPTTNALNNIGSRLVGKLSLSSYMMPQDKAGAGDKLKPPTIKRLSFLGILTQTLGNIILIMVASFVLLTASILFLIRTVTLIFIYILSPLAFISKLLPKYDKFDPWLKKLISQSFFAPGFLIPLYLVFVLLGDSGIAAIVAKKGESVVDGNISLIIFDLIILGMLISCIYLGRELGAMGMDAAMKGAGKINSGLLKGMGKVGGGATNLAGRIPMGSGRTIGSMAGNVSTRIASTGAGRLASQGWNSSSMKKIRESNMGKAIKNPLLYSSDKVGALAGAAGVSGVNILGNTGAERKEQADKEKKRVGDIEASLIAAADAPSAAIIVSGISTSDIVKLKPAVLGLDKVAVNLTFDQLTALNTKLNPAQKAAIKRPIIAAGATAPGHVFMTTGAGMAW